jgi:arabinose-5-phosphate isomerase
MSIDKLKDLVRSEYKNISSALNQLAEDKTINEIKYISDLVIKTKQANGKVIFTGIGKNVYACQKLAASFSSIGIPSFFMDAVHAVHGDLGVIGNNDMLICMSKSGNTSELINTLIHLYNNKERFNFPIIGIDCNVSGTKNGFDQYCDYTIHINSFEEIDSMNIVPTTSAIILQIVGDLIGVYSAEALGFNRELFKLNHPGGTIGQTLSK